MVDWLTRRWRSVGVAVGAPLIIAALMLLILAEAGAATASPESTFHLLPRQDLALTGFDEFEVHIGDVNGNGRDDLILNNRCQAPTQGGCGSTANLVAVALSNGDGTFAIVPVRNLGPTGWHRYNLFTGDVNGNGRTDLIWIRDPDPDTSPDTAYAWIAFSTIFGYQLDTTVRTWDLPYGYNGNVGDFNGDGMTDVYFGTICSLHERTSCWASRSNFRFIAYSQGDGSFSALDLRYPDPDFWDELTDERGSDYLTHFADIDGDGVTDVVWNSLRQGTPPNQTTRNLVWTSLWDLNNTGYPYDLPQVIGSTGWSGYKLFPGDVNGDGRDDLVWNHRTATENYIWVALSDGNGYFTRLDPVHAALPLEDPSGWSGYAPAIGDFNGDGRLDIAFNNLSSPLGGNRVMTRYGQTSGRFGPIQAWVGGEDLPWSGFSLRVGDVNGDGKDDLIWIAQGSPARVQVALGVTIYTSLLPGMVRASSGAW